jgi:hypothetical protein
MRHVRPSIRMENSAPTGRIFMKFDVWGFFGGKNGGENSFFNQIGQKWSVLYMKTNVHFLSYLAQFFLEFEMFQTKAVETIQTHILCSVTFFFLKSCRLLDNVEHYCRGEISQLPIWRMHIGWWMTKGTNTHSVCVTVTAFSLQQWLHESASILRYTYIVACLVFINRTLSEVQLSSCIFFRELWFLLQFVVVSCL